MRKISIRALRRITSNEFFCQPYAEDAEKREEIFRKTYLVPTGSDYKKEWNSRAKELRKKYADFLADFTVQVGYPGVSKRDNTSICIQGDVELRVKEYSYGAKLDLLRVYIYGFPREFRRLIKEEKVHKKEFFERVKYEIDVSTGGKSLRDCLVLYEGYSRKPYHGAPDCYTKGTVWRIEAERNGKHLYFRPEIKAPQHIPLEQEYLWVMEHLSNEDNFKRHMLDMHRGTVKCCGTKLSDYSSSINFCPKCGRDVKEIFKKIVFDNFCVTKLSSVLLFSSGVLELEDAPYNYVTTKRTRSSSVPIY